MRLGYTAKIKSAASVAEQREAMDDVGAGKVLDEGAPIRKPKPGQDPRPKRTRLVKILRPGDEFCVYSASHLARDAGDLFTVLAAITACGASLYVIDMAKTFTASPDQAALARAFVGDKRKAQTDAARKAPKKKRGGRPKAMSDLTKAEWAEFDRAWNDGGVDREQMARRWKVSIATIGRKAAARGLGPKA